MKKANTTRVTLRYKWGSNFCQHLYIDYYPPIIDDNGNETRREFLRMKITPLLKADGTPKGKKTGVFPIKFFAKMFEIFDFLSITKAIEFNLNCNLKGRK